MSWCQSRWSSVTLSRVAAVHARVCVVASWKLESSSTQTSGSWPSSSAARRASSALGETLPAVHARRPAAAIIAATMRTVVVLPLVPVIPSTRGA